MKSTPGVKLSLVGYRMDPNFPEPDFFTLTLDDEDDAPILFAGRIILFHEPDQAQTALDLYLADKALPAQVAPTELTVVYDYAQALYHLATRSRDESAFIVNVVNNLLDLLKAASIGIPQPYKGDLHALADHLTFDRDYGDFLKANELSRGDLIEAVQWGLGAAMTKAMFVPKPSIVFRDLEGAPTPIASSII